jgi:uncharacterized phage protein (TIGR01671 family)
MKEYKFRAWDIRANKMFEVVSVDFESGSVKLKKDTDYNNNFERDYKTSKDGVIKKEVELMEYINRKDMNDFEIYDGDIINHYGSEANYVIKYGVYKRKNHTNSDRQVKHLGWYCKPIANYSKKYDIAWNYEIESIENFINDVEVIGNIYADQELLK